MPNIKEGGSKKSTLSNVLVPLGLVAAKKVLGDVEKKQKKEDIKTKK